MTPRSGRRVSMRRAQSEKVGRHDLEALSQRWIHARHMDEFAGHHSIRSIACGKGHYAVWSWAMEVHTRLVQIARASWGMSEIINPSARCLARCSPDSDFAKFRAVDLIQSCSRKQDKCILLETPATEDLAERSLLASTSPPGIVDTPKCTAISCGNFHSVVQTVNGKLLAFGLGACEARRGDEVDRATPARVSGWMAGHLCFLARGASYVSNPRTAQETRQTDSGRRHRGRLWGWKLWKVGARRLAKFPRCLPDSFRS